MNIENVNNSFENILTENLMNENRRLQDELLNISNAHNINKTDLLNDPYYRSIEKKRKEIEDEINKRFMNRK